MPNKVLFDEFDGTPAQITFRDTTDFNPAAANDLRHASAVDVEVQIDCTDLADSAYRQSAKADLGAIRAPAYKLRAAIEFAATPTSGDPVYFYWAPSQHATAANGNPGNATGSDAAWDGYSSDGDVVVAQLEFIGTFVNSGEATTTIQKAEVGILVPASRYGMLIVRNEAGAAFHSDMVETHFVLDPVYVEIQ